MERPRALVRRAFAHSLFVLLSGSLVGCSAELEKLPRTQSHRDSLGQEIYKSLCRRVAATEMPMDLDGRESEALCLGDAQQSRAALEAQRGVLPDRLLSLVERRQAIADALDEALPGELADGLEHMLRGLLPFYDPPEERIQQGTRALADVLTRLVGNDAALEGMARFTRAGMLPNEGEQGLLRGLFGYGELVKTLRAALPPLTGDAAVAPAFKAALEGLALELATTELEREPDSDTCRTRSLLQRAEVEVPGEAKQFATGTPLFAVLRDARGMPVPARASGEVGRDQLSACGDGSGAASGVPFPFVDGDNDGFADIDGPSFLAADGFEGSLPEPFPVPGEQDVARDQNGRALGIGADGGVSTDAPLYATRDVDGSLLAAVLREGAGLFAGERSVFSSFAAALPALLGDTRASKRDYEKKTYEYQATDTNHSPLVDLVHASGALIADPVYDESLELSLQLLREHESEMVSSLEPVLAIERRTRPATDAYPKAVLEGPNTFWDELLTEVEKLSRRRKSAGGETMLEAVARSMLGVGRNFEKPDAPVEQLVDPRVLSHQGALLATMLRFKDEWRVNPVGESKRKPGEAGVLGSFKTPVDRDKPDSPITCGKDGCAGPIASSAFAAFALPGQNCVIQRAGRPAGAKDCGEPSNQSLFQRSMGMLAEMEGRSQCNRPILVDDLFSFAEADGEMQSPQERANTIRDAENALAKDYTCPDDPAAPCRAYAAKYPAAFVDADGAGPAKPTIQECGLLDLADVGRTFGKVLTHEYRLEIPNPWVRRYLEDVARAADAGLPACPEQFINDPTQVPDCIPEAARLSRNVFEELAPCKPTDEGCVDTLGELVEFLLDDNSLFQNERDAAELRPDARALSRVMFTPAGSSNFLLFAPLLVRGAPVGCEAAPGVKACLDDSLEPAPGSCCIKDLMEPPLRYRLDTFYGSTTFAWEQTLKLKDGGELSFLEAMAPISDAFNRLDVAPGDDPRTVEDPRYGLTVLGSIVASHFDSPENPAAQNSNPTGPGYRKLTGLVRYEELLADLLDDGSLVASQVGASGQQLFDPAVRYTADQQLGLVQRGFGLLQALDSLSFHGSDGIAATAKIAESWLNPHVYCAGSGGDSRVIAGRGACNGGGVRPPLATRSGRDYECWNDGTCFDGKAGVAKRFLSPADLLIDAAADVKNRSLASPELHGAARAVLSGLLDNYAQIDAGHLKSRRLRAVVLTLGEYMRERWAEERAAGRLNDWGRRNTDDVIDMLTNPAAAGALDTFYQLSQRPGALEEISRMLASVLSETATSRALLSYAADALLALPGDESSNALARAFAAAVAPNVAEVLAGTQASLTVDKGLVFNNVFMMAEMAKVDDDGVLGQVLGNLVRAPGQRPGTGPLPMSTLFDAIMDINRLDPNEQGPHTAADYRAAFTRMADVMNDERRGFERLYSIVQCTRGKGGKTACD